MFSQYADKNLDSDYKSNLGNISYTVSKNKQGRKRPLDTPKRMIERREKGEIQGGREREGVKERVKSS